MGLPLAILAAASVAAQNPAPVPLYDNLGTLTHRISSRIPRAQRFFDQGLRLTYGFNHGEAIKAFREAARLDATCAICWWGVAYAYGPNINAPMDSAAGLAAWDAVGRALTLRRHASSAEQAYIDAIALRYGANPAVDRAKRDSAWAVAIQNIARRYPSDLDAATLAAEAQMTMRPWNYWTADTTAYPGIDGAIATLEAVLARNPDHPGACHFYIHAVEASKDARRALPCARRLASLMPGAGHLVHMPAHIYIRLGMYEDARQANIHAAHTDETYIADARPDGMYPIAYYPHNLHFLWAAAAFDGRRAEADDAIRRLRTASPAAMALQVPPLELLVLPAYYHMVWFGKWDEILREPRPPEGLLTTTGMWRYARGRALAATGRLAEARAELDSLKALLAVAPSRIPAGMTLGFAPPTTLLGIADAVLSGEIAARDRRYDEAVERLRAAVTLYSGLTYSEPFDWYYSPRLSLGAVLLEAGRPAEAEAVLREDLGHNPNSGWALKGLERALTAQGKTAEAARVAEEFRQAWARSDTPITSSRM